MKPIILKHFVKDKLRKWEKLLIDRHALPLFGAGLAVNNPEPEYSLMMPSEEEMPFSVIIEHMENLLMLVKVSARNEGGLTRDQDATVVTVDPRRLPAWAAAPQALRLLAAPTSVLVEMEGVPCRAWQAMNPFGEEVYLFVHRAQIPTGGEVEKAAEGFLKEKPLEKGLPGTLHIR